MDSGLIELLSEISNAARRSPVMVGGSAVEFYTGGMYTTGDVDIVGNSKEIAPILLTLGFSKEGRYFIKDKIFIDIVGSRLYGRYNEIAIKGTDHVIRVISVEDLLVDRLCACKWWRSNTDCEQARYLYGIYLDRLDMDYLKDRALEEDVMDRLEEIGSTV
ncbi:MAG: DUF6036 family nucleotidyltransferase [Candidatus Thermoplasmatota archaeon]|nr:DUF6036 family nucleotidyltransferase [Candidatus Thermoplasmatota archaeon]